jgi:biotin-(acetyl-CoA carboxylase) ligase
MNASTPEEVAAWTGRPKPVSLREHLGNGLPRAPLLALLLRELAIRWKALEGGGSVRAEILDELHRRDALAGCLVEVSKTTGPEGATIIGEARGFGPEGQLLVRQVSGTVMSLFAGEVTVRKHAQADPKRGRAPGP